MGSEWEENYLRFYVIPTQIYKFWDTGNMATIDSYIYIMIKYIGT